jgi:hypothetical protein
MSFATITNSQKCRRQMADDVSERQMLLVEWQSSSQVHLVQVLVIDILVEKTCSLPAKFCYWYRESFGRFGRLYKLMFIFQFMIRPSANIDWEWKVKYICVWSVSKFRNIKLDDCCSHETSFSVNIDLYWRRSTFVRG